MLRILRANQVLDRTGETRSPLYAKALVGLFTRPLKIGGGRASGWPEHEVDAIVAARIRGDSNAQISALVTRLHERRKVLMTTSEVASAEATRHTTASKPVIADTTHDAVQGVKGPTAARQTPGGARS